MTLRLHVLGAGHSGRRFTAVAETMPDVRLLHRASAGSARGERAALFEQALEDPDVQMIVVATPPPEQTEHASRALTAGKHVILEKPGALDPEPLEGLAEVRGERLLLFPYHLSLNPFVGRMADLVADGELGTRLHGNFRMHVAEERRALGWLASDGRGGGPLVETLTHGFHLMAHLLGRIADIRAVLLHGGRSPSSYDGASVLVDHEGGHTSALEVSWLGRRSVASGFVEVVGEQGAASVHRGHLGARSYTYRSSTRAGESTDFEPDDDVGFRRLLRVSGSLLEGVEDARAASRLVSLETAVDALAWARAACRRAEER